MITKPRVTIEQVLKDPACSSWFRNALKSALDRDPVDAANDAALLYRLLDRRCHEIHEQFDARDVYKPAALKVRR